MVTSVNNKQQKVSTESTARDNYLRVNLLYNKWVNWLFYLALSYLIVYFVWLDLERRLFRTINSLTDHIHSRGPLSIHSNFKDLLNFCFVKLPLLTVAVVGRGAIFCADGIVSSWLKTPFGQITYSINKSGAEASKVDEIVTILTEINEHFKETFKKFGILTLSTSLQYVAQEIGQNKGQLSSSRSSVVSDVINSLSLAVPIIFAMWRMRTAAKLVKKLEFKNEQQQS